MNQLSDPALSPSVDTDNWHLVTDAKQRKRIQDRLAQRARRKRLREARNRTDTYELRSEATQGLVLSTSSSIVRQDERRGSNSPRATPRTDLPEQQNRSKQTGWNFHLNINLELPHNLTGIGAWYFNCQLLRVPVCHSMPARSRICPPDIPESLHPTPIQLLTVHPLGIDGFPFPTLRDNLIKMGGLVFDEEDFTRDMYIGCCFTITPGGKPWDPTAWKMGKEFEDKWGFLFN